MVHMQYPIAEFRRGIKKDRRKKPQGKNIMSASATQGGHKKGVRQGGILSPFLFRFYIRDLILSITSSNIGCNFADINVSLLAYADDLVLLAPSWRALQSLLRAVEVAGISVNMTFNQRWNRVRIFDP